ncbi:hypothetical protein U0355_01190 [Salimicrobium sp. PL1-032A]|uniref:hypothetical protein n=1 Tax=Salimicrobium sp. PL1-032A TaxID=3095364 RepID=UPI0032619BD8
MFLVIRGSKGRLEILHHAAFGRFKTFSTKEEAEYCSRQLNAETKNTTAWRVVREEEIYRQ